MQFGFGSGVLVATLTNGGANPTPRNFGILQDVSVDFDAPIKELMGSYQFPVAVARGKGKIIGKAKFANIDIAAYNDLFFGGTSATGETMMAINEAAVIPATPFQVTVANSANFVADEGVYNRTTGKFMTNVASAPATGQYSFAAGVYTFAAADTGNSLYINYQYTVSASGHTVTLTNQLLGQQPTFSIVLAQVYNNQQFNLKLNQCVANKLGFATKLEDFQIPNFEFAAFADSAGNLGQLSTAL